MKYIKIIAVGLLVIVIASVIFVIIQQGDNTPSKKEQEYSVPNWFVNSLIDEWNPRYFKWKDKKYVLFQEKESGIVFMAIKVLETQQGNWMKEEYSPVFILYKNNYKNMKSILIYQDSIYTIKNNLITKYDLVSKKILKKHLKFDSVLGIYDNSIYIKSKNEYQKIDINLKSQPEKIKKGALPKNYSQKPEKYKFAI